jgi:hypothetical protein
MKEYSFSFGFMNRLKIDLFNIFPVEEKFKQAIIKQSKGLSFLE